MDYFNILNLNKEPFSNSPDPEFFFHSRQHLDCLQKLELSLLLRRGLNVVIGDVGTGKTTLCRQLIRRFAQKKEMETYLILDPHFLYASEFLVTVAKLLTGKKLPVGSHDRQIKEYIKQYLFRKGVDQGKTIVLIIDEGQKIPAFCLEILREFLNYETNEYKLLQIVIFAQSEFEKTVRKYPNFADRISLYHLLNPLSFLDTRRMIKFRLEKSSNSRKKLNLFTYPALWAIFCIAGGYPRRIINLCHQSMLSMIIQNRSRCNYFLVKKCARRVFREESRRWKILIATAVMGAAAAVILLIFLPLDRFKMGQSQAIREVKTEFFLNPNLEITDPILEAKTLSLNGRIVPGNFSTPNRMKPEVVPATPERVEEPVKTERFEEKAPIVASVDIVVQNTRAELKPTPTYSTILGRITLKHKETLSLIMRQVYGGFNSNYLKSFIITNPEIENPDRVTVGQIISLPAIPVEVAPGDNRVWWIKVDETDTLEGAINILRKHPESSPGVRLIPYWNPAGGSKFAVVLGELFEDEKTARTQQEKLPGELSSGSTIFSQWDKKTVFFANPYFVFSDLSELGTVRDKN
ncbi:MAG: AAA family ATPase [Desulfobacterales bacterium]|nr:AAA family ATPase [Desulfobacterales bacterium]